MIEMLTHTPRICLHADANGDPAHCPCAVPAGMVAEDWEVDNGHRYRILTIEDEDAWVFVVQLLSGRIDDGRVVERPAGFTPARALRDDGIHHHLPRPLSTMAPAFAIQLARATTGRMMDGGV
jgi:hypothetical protein